MTTAIKNLAQNNIKITKATLIKIIDSNYNKKIQLIEIIRTFHDHGINYDIPFIKRRFPDLSSNPSKEPSDVDGDSIDTYIYTYSSTEILNTIAHLKKTYGNLLSNEILNATAHIPYIEMQPSFV